MDVRCRQSDLQSQDAPIARGLCPFPRDMEGLRRFCFGLIRINEDYGIRFPGNQEALRRLRWPGGHTRSHSELGS